MDKQYQSQRRIRQFRNKPKHALYGVTAGATSLVTSVASGFEGLATKPLEGAETGGAAGFFKGVGMGLVGYVWPFRSRTVRYFDAARLCRAVTKPAVGIFDFANNVTEGTSRSLLAFLSSGLRLIRPLARHPKHDDRL